jgi:hypothetical protein
MASIQESAGDLSGGLHKFFEPSVPPSSTNIYKWMKQCVMRLEPFNFVEDPEVLDNTKLKPICVKTLMKYLVRTAKVVERKLAKRIPDKFGIVFDGWSMGGEHYIAIFLSWCDGKDVCIRLICCGVQDEVIDEEGATGFSAEDIGDYLFDELDLLGRPDVLLVLWLP